MVSYVFFWLFIPIGMSEEGRREKGGNRHGNGRRKKGMKSTHHITCQGRRLRNTP